MSTAVPPASAELMLFLEDKAVLRERLGPTWCEKQGIGALRRRFGQGPPNVIPIKRAVEESRCILAEVCRKCGLCALAGK